MEQACRHTGKTPEELGLAGPSGGSGQPGPGEGEDAVPPGGEALWSWFLELHQGRGSNGFGPAPLSWTDIEAWARLYGMDVSPYELSTLKSMDLSWLSARAEAEKKQ